MALWPVEGGGEAIPLSRTLVRKGADLNASIQETPGRDFLTELLALYWFAPPVALWRAVELRTAAAEVYHPPLLDLGCGDGLVGRALFGLGGADAGLDPWAEQVVKAARLGVYRWTQRGDGHHLPYRSAAFATVFSNSVLEHIPDVAPVVREVGRVLRPGGRFIFTVPSDAFCCLLYFYQLRKKAGDREGARRYGEWVDRWLAHYHYHTPQEWADLLTEGGMVLEKTRYYIPPLVEQLWDRMNLLFGLDRRSVWGLLVSPRLRGLPYQPLLARWVVRRFSRTWRAYYEMDVPPGQLGGGLLVVGRKHGDLR